MRRLKLLAFATAVLAYSCGGGSAGSGSATSPTALKPMQTCDFTVNSTADTVDANPGDGNCADSSGNCTLRAAIMQANAQGGTKVICLGSGQTYTLSRDTAAGDDDMAAAYTTTTAHCPLPTAPSRATQPKAAVAYTTTAHCPSPTAPSQATALVVTAVA